MIATSSSGERFWQLVLDLDPSEVSRWIAALRTDPWGARAARG